MASSVVNTFAAQVIARSPSQATRKRALIGAIVFDLGLLGVFKYLGFFVSELDGALESIGLGSPLPLVQIVLPIGISFFTFQAISYVVDVYRGETPAASLVDVAILQAFFPHIVAGPIVRANELLPQLRTPRDPRTVLAGPAIFLIVGGIVKKTVIADELARRVVDPVYSDPAAHSARRADARVLRLRRADLLRLLRLHGHGDRAGAAARLPAAAELQPALPRAVAPGLLAALAHDAVALAARLPLHPARRQPRRAG